MKTNFPAMVPVLVAAVLLMYIFQVEGQLLSMSSNTFDDQYLKCAGRMETKFVPKLLTEEKANHQLFHSVWTEAASRWDSRKAQLALPPDFQDNHGIALLAYTSHAHRDTAFYQEFSSAVERAGTSRDDYIYNFQFKALHFYLTRAVQLLSQGCTESYRRPAYTKSRLGLSGSHGHDGIRFGHFFPFGIRPEPLADAEVALTVYSCFGVSTEVVSDSGSGSILIPLNEIFTLTHEGNGTNFVLRSTNKTCSYFDCAYLGGLKTEGCVDSTGQLKPKYTNWSPGLKSKEKEDEMTEMDKTQEPVEDPGQRKLDYFDNPVPALLPFPSKSPTAASASTSSGGTHLPLLGRFSLSLGFLVVTRLAHL